MAGFFERINTHLPDCGPAKLRACIAVDIKEGSVPFAVSFDASCSHPSDGVTLGGFSWDFSDGSSGSGETVAQTYTSVGEYDVIVTAQDNAGQTDKDTVTVTALPAAAPGIVRINAGGGNLVDQSSNLWLADAHFSGGSAGTNPDVQIAGTDNGLYPAHARSGHCEPAGYCARREP